MKKVSLLMMVLGLFVLASCSKDDENVMTDLTGSTFSAYMYHDFATDADVYETYRFISNDMVERTLRHGGPRGRIFTTFEGGTYYVVYPNIYIRGNSGEVNGIFIDEKFFRIGLYEYLRQ